MKNCYFMTIDNSGLCKRHVLPINADAVNFCSIRHENDMPRPQISCYFYEWENTRENVKPFFPSSKDWKPVKYEYHSQHWNKSIINCVASQNWDLIGSDHFVAKNIKYTNLQYWNKSWYSRCLAYCNDYASWVSIRSILLHFSTYLRLLFVAIVRLWVVTNSRGQ